MNRRVRLVVPVALAAAGLIGASALRAADQPAPAAAEPVRTARPIELFNGRDLTGWTVFLSDAAVDPASVVTVESGVLRFAGKPNGFLRTTRSYSNYRLHVEWRWPANAAPKSNSGVFVHLHGPDQIWPDGVECQLASGNAGQLVGNNVALPGAPISNKKPRAPKFAASSEKPLGEWNSYDIVCRDGSIDLTVNGVHQNHVEKCSVQAGQIGLQMEGYPIEFRNIRLEPQ